MEMTQIRYFLAVSETLNFTRAAELCFISQPALTKGIKKLEASIGGELLHRTKTSVELSYLGEKLLPKFRQIYLDADTAKKEAKRLLQSESTLLRIGIQSSIFIGCLLPIFQGFLTENPGVQFEFIESDRHELKRKLDNHDVEMVFFSTLKDEGNDDSAQEIYIDDFVIAFGDKHPFAERASITTQDLEHERFCYRTHCTSSHQLDHHLSKQGVELNIVYSSDRDDRVKSFVVSNFGVTFMPKTQALSEGLGFVELSDYAVTRAIVLEVSDSEEACSAMCRRFLSSITDLANAYSRQLQIIEADEDKLLNSGLEEKAKSADALKNAC